MMIFSGSASSMVPRRDEIDRFVADEEAAFLALA
jgi:hypothetical protein